MSSPSKRLSGEKRTHTREYSQEPPKRTKTTGYHIASLPKEHVTDKDGHFIIREGDILPNELQIMRKIGEGTFSKVVECMHLATPGMPCFAVKVVKARRKYAEYARQEIQALRADDPEDQWHVVSLLNDFMVHDHICMVFPLLGYSLFDFLKANNYRGFPITRIREIARQLLECTCYFHQHQLIHTDLKPENILFETTKKVHMGGDRVLPESSKIRVIDFGSSIYQHQKHAAIVQTRHYRALEVILGLEWSFPADMWSLGCILVELLTGDALFLTHNTHEHLAMMDKALDALPPLYATPGTPADISKLYDQDGHLLSLAQGTEAARYLSKKVKPLSDLLVDCPVFYDLVRHLLAYDPSKRFTAREALQHKFFDVARVSRSISPLVGSLGNDSENEQDPTRSFRSNSSSLLLSSRTPDSIRSLSRTPYTGDSLINTNEHNATPQQEDSDPLPSEKMAHSDRNRKKSKDRQKKEVQPHVKTLQYLEEPTLLHRRTLHERRVPKLYKPPEEKNRPPLPTATPDAEHVAYRWTDAAGQLKPIPQFYTMVGLSHNGVLFADKPMVPYGTVVDSVIPSGTHSTEASTKDTNKE